MRLRLLIPEFRVQNSSAQPCFPRPSPRLTAGLPGQPLDLTSHFRDPSKPPNASVRPAQGTKCEMLTQIGFTRYLGQSSKGRTDQTVRRGGSQSFHSSYVFDSCGMVRMDQACEQQKSRTIQEYLSGVNDVALCGMQIRTSTLFVGRLVCMLDDNVAISNS